MIAHSIKRLSNKSQLTSLVQITRISLLLSCTLLLNLAAADEKAVQEDLHFFESKIRPVLIEHCYSCHSGEAEKLRGNLLLDSKSGWETGGDSGEPAIRPEDPDGSLLIQTIRHLVPGMEMPPEGPKLSDSQIADITEWVRRGAFDPRDGQTAERKRADASWWSLQPIATEFHHSSIDDFVDAKLSAQNLHRNPPADPRTLIRRLYFDLHGLPPSSEEVEKFIADYSSLPDRQQQKELIAGLVDQLLASPRYGERWGRHWLDVVRFGESIGFERNEIVNNIYPFRDYVIESINQDKPYHQMIREHLAGDVLAKDKPEVEIGSAFLVAGPWDDVGNQDAVAAANIRAATLDEIITTTGSAFLGMTIHCARCHHHKFDPIPTEDYYRIRAAIEGVTHGSREVATSQQREERQQKLAPLHQELQKQQTDRTAFIQEIDKRAGQKQSSTPYPRGKVDSYGTEEAFEPVEAKFVRLVMHSITTDDPAGGRRNGTGGQLTEFEVWTPDAESRNIALATHGTKASGAKSMHADDFPEAYGPQYCIDGVLGQAWFVGHPAILTLEFPAASTINRIRFMNARGEKENTDDSQVRGGTPCEYEVQISLDGTQWTTVASDEGREPWSESHRVGKLRRQEISAEEQAKVAEFDRCIGELHAQIGVVPGLPVWFVGNRRQPSEPTRVHQGGDPMKPLEPIKPGSLALLDGAMSGFELPEDAPEGLRRLALAQWIARDNNPLTRRVMVNRIWHYHFGTGLVDSPSDFGYLGSLPSHPELLDYLAEQFRKSDWRWKPLHREILLSETYLQSSADQPEGSRLDKSARLLWRFPPRRLSAEEVRDTMLSVAGKLQLEPMGGPGFRLYRYTQNNVSTFFPLDNVGPETYRRSVYHQNARASVVDILTDFDFPDIAFAAPARSSTVSPMQALTLMNHSFVEDMAQSVAARIRTETATEEQSIAPVDQQVQRAFQLYFQRAPTPEERDASRALIERFNLEIFCRAMWNANEFVFLD